jgi:hypothetical protein
MTMEGFKRPTPPLPVPVTAVLPLFTFGYDDDWLYGGGEPSRELAPELGEIVNALGDVSPARHEQKKHDNNNTILNLGRDSIEEHLFLSLRVSQKFY